MELVGPLELARPPGPLHQRRVDGELLAGRALGEDGEEHGEVGHRRDDLLHAHHGHVHARQRRRHAAVALVGDEDHRARLGHRKVGAGDPEIGLQELLAQFLARDLREDLRVGGQAGPVQLTREQLGHLPLRLVDGRRDDMRGALVGELDDVLAEVGLHRRHADRLQRVVEVDLFRGHRLGLHGHARAGAPGDVEDDPACLLGRRREVHVAADPLDVGDERLEVRVQPLERRLLDGAGAVAQRLALGKVPEGLAAQRDELRRRDVERLVQEAVPQGVGGALAEGRGDDRLAHRSSWGAPIWPPRSFKRKGLRPPRTPPAIARTRPGAAVARLGLDTGCLIDAPPGGTREPRPGAARAAVNCGAGGHRGSA